MANKTLQAARKEKNDEFYTQLADIENELKHYRQHFEGKTVLCNCDDPYESNFFKYFAMNFNFLKLKKLIATCYDSSPIAFTQLSLLGDGKTIPNGSRKAYRIELTGVKDYNGDGAIDLADVEYMLRYGDNPPKKLNGNGDFRSEECLKLLKQADIVVTNPPFSLFREYVAKLIEYDKKFIIIGNQNAITYKEIFPLLKDNKMWLGYNSGAQIFRVPATIERKNLFVRDGVTYAKFGNICWYTNLEQPKRHELLPLYKKYTPEEYPKYDNYDAIEVSKVADIPCDYFPSESSNGDMGVPITFLDKYNPEQFEIIGLLNSSSRELAGILALKVYDDFKEMRQDLTYTGSTGRKTNGNPVLKGKPQKGNFFVNPVTNEYIFSAYARILIRRRKSED